MNNYGFKSFHSINFVNYTTVLYKLYNKLLANIAKYPVVGKFGDGNCRKEIPRNYNSIILIS